MAFFLFANIENKVVFFMCERPFIVYSVRNTCFAFYRWLRLYDGWQPNMFILIVYIYITVLNK